MTRVVVVTALCVSVCFLRFPWAAPLEGRTPLPSKKPEPIRAFCIDFNWGPGGVNAFAGPGAWADACPEKHVAWYRALGANVIQTFAVSCNGYGWYRGGVVPPQPGLKHDFLAEVVRLGHLQGMKVMGYFCVGANTRWGQEHRDLSYGIPASPHIPFTDEYLDYLAGAIRDSLEKTGMDGFMIDWVWNPDALGDMRKEQNGGRWLDCEKRLFTQLLGKPFPGEDRIVAEDKLAYDRKAIDRAWARIRAAAKDARPDCVIWLSCCNLQHPSVVDSPLFREVDWLMNEAPDPKALEAAKKMAGPRTRLVQCLVGWGDQHDAKRVLLDPASRGLGVYGFAKPGPDSFPGPIERYLSEPIESFQGNDRNIAALARFFNGLPFEHRSEAGGAHGLERDGK